MKSCLPILFLMISHVLLAQRAEMEKVDVKIKQLPLKPFEKSVKKYNYRIINSTPLTLPPPETVSGFIKLGGFEFSADAPDVTILVYLDKYDEKMSSVPVKNINSAQFTYGINASIDVRLSFLTGDNQFEYYKTSRLLTDQANRYTYQSSLTYATEAAALDAGSKDQYMFDQAKQSCLNVTLNGIGNYLRDMHGYFEYEMTIPVWSMKAKSFDYSDMDEAQNKALAGLKSYSENGLNDENKILFQDAITIWENVLKEYNADDKKARINKKNVGALYANLAIAHNWLMHDREALNYLDLLNQSRGSSWAERFSDLINSSVTGREQDARRNNNTLAIEKIKSPLFFSHDFVVKGHASRIKAIQKYNFLDKKLPEERRFFEYLDNGLLSRTYTEFYDVKSHSWERRRDYHTIKYDHEKSLMYIFEKDPNIPAYVRKFKDGKLVYQRTQLGQYDSSIVKCFYNSAGLLERYVVNPEVADRHSEVRYTYADGKLIRREILKNKNNELKPFSKIQYVWNGDKLIKTQQYRAADNGAYTNKPLETDYSYDVNGFLSGIIDGVQQQKYSADQAGNITDVYVRSDDGSHDNWTYIWETGTGNASLYTTKVDEFNGPEQYPALY